MQIDLPNSSALDTSITDTFSNFRLLGIGKPTAKQVERKSERKEKRAEAKEERETLGTGRRILNVAQKFNPFAASLRLALLACARLNVLGISRRLYPAFLTDEELKNRHFDLDNAKKVKKIWDDKVSKLYINLGGRTLTLKNAIVQGYNKPIFNTKKIKAAKAQEKSSFNGDVRQLFLSVPSVEPKMNFDCSQLDLGISFDGDEQYSNFEPVSDSVLVAEGIGLAGTIAKMLNNGGVAQNPYAKDSSDYSSAQSDITTAENNGSLAATPVSDKELQQAINQAKPDKDAGGDPMGEDGEDMIMGIPSTWFWIGAGVLTLSAILLIALRIKKNKIAAAKV